MAHLVAGCFELGDTDLAQTNNYIRSQDIDLLMRAGPLQVMSVVKGLMKTGMTICATIHSPTPTCFRLFDRMMILLRGHMVYAGPNGGASALSLPMAASLTAGGHIHDAHPQCPHESYTTTCVSLHPRRLGFAKERGSLGLE